jgi:hypothetical protein
MNHFTTTMLVCGIMVAVLPAAADTTCPPNLNNTTVNGNVIVPAGQSCFMQGATVTGNVQVQTNAALTFVAPLPPSTIVGNVSVGTGASFNADSGGLTIDGNFKANQCVTADMNSEDTVGGNVQIQYCTRGVAVTNSNIGGNVTCNNSGICDIFGNKVNGNAEVNDNSSAAVGNNRIGNNLECQGNASITDDGVPNTVGGHKNGQCANF